MNGTTLAHHTQLIEWCSKKRLYQDPKGLDILHKTKQSVLTPEKYEVIGNWCSDVNRLFMRPPEKHPPQLFRVCKYSDDMLPPNKSTLKTRSVNPPAKLWTNPGKKSNVRSAVLTGKATIKPEDKERFVDDVKNTALAAKMADTTDHYVQERKVVRLHIQPEWKRKLSTGWTINRPMLYPKNPPPPPAENLLVDVPDYLIKNEENRMEIYYEGSVVKKPDNSCIVEKTGTPKILSVSEQRDSQEILKDTSICDGGDVQSKGTQWEAVPESEGLDEESKGEGEEDALTPRSRYKPPIISDRSTSNNILNVLSVDDCKMMLRYRPMRVIDTQDSMILPPAKPPASPEADKEGHSDDATVEDTATTTQNTPIRLSQGSAKTTLTPSQVRSRVNAYREMYDTYSKMTPEAKVPRPSSAAVEKAFDVLLDKQFQACQSSRRPLSCPPPKAATTASARSRPSSRGSNHSSSTTSTPSAKFQQMNATLRQQMYDLLDSRWHLTKMKFHRSKNGYSAKQSMKKGRMVTSSPKESWTSDENLAKD